MKVKGEANVLFAPCDFRLEYGTAWQRNTGECNESALMVKIVWPSQSSEHARKMNHEKDGQKLRAVQPSPTVKCRRIILPPPSI
jgi:hypothetical protein